MLHNTIPFSYAYHNHAIWLPNMRREQQSQRYLPSGFGFNSTMYRIADRPPKHTDCGWRSMDACSIREMLSWNDVSWLIWLLKVSVSVCMISPETSTDLVPSQVSSADFDNHVVRLPWLYHRPHSQIANVPDHFEWTIVPLPWTQAFESNSPYHLLALFVVSAAHEDLSIPSILPHDCAMTQTRTNSHPNTDEIFQFRESPYPALVSGNVHLTMELIFVPRLMRDEVLTWTEVLYVIARYFRFIYEWSFNQLLKDRLIRNTDIGPSLDFTGLRSVIQYVQAAYQLEMFPSLFHPMSNHHYRSG